MSEMTDERASQIIHKARGLCRHKAMRGEPVKPGYNTTFYKCKACEEPMHLNSQFGNPNYTDPTSYLEAMAWAKKQDWFEEFLKVIAFATAGKTGFIDYRSIGEDYIGRPAFATILLDPKPGSHAFASYLEGREG